MRRNDPALMAALPRPLGRRVASLRMEVDRDHLAQEAQVLARVDGKVLHLPLGQLTPQLLRGTAAVRRLGSYDKARSNLALHPVERDGLHTHVWAESQLELAHLRQIDRERRFAWYDTQRLILYWPVTRNRCLWHVPDIAAVDADRQPWLLDVKNRDALQNSTHARGQLMLTAATCAQLGWGYRVLSDMSRQRQANLNGLRVHFRLAPELEDNVRAALRVRSSLLGDVIDDAGGRPDGHSAAMHLLAQGLIDVDLDRPLSDAMPVVWHDWSS